MNVWTALNAKGELSPRENASKIPRSLFVLVVYDVACTYGIRAAERISGRVDLCLFGAREATTF